MSPIPSGRSVRKKHVYLIWFLKLLTLFFYPKAIVFDNENATMYLYGGGYQSPLGTIQETLQDLWTYNIVTDTWVQQTITNQISPARYASAVAALNNQPQKRILVFSGYYVSGASYSFTGNDLWILEEVSGKLTFLFSIFLLFMPNTPN
mgnify:CR=1 FL=1